VIGCDIGDEIRGMVIANFVVTNPYIHFASNKEGDKGLINYINGDWVLVDQVIRQLGINGL